MSGNGIMCHRFSKERSPSCSKPYALTAPTVSGFLWCKIKPGLFYTNFYTIWVRRYTISWEFMKWIKILKPLRHSALRAFEKKGVVLCICARWRCIGDIWSCNLPGVSNSLPPIQKKCDSWITPLLHQIKQVGVFWTLKYHTKLQS